MPRVYAAGEPVCLLGRRYRLRIEPSDRDRAAIQGEEVVLFLRNPENESQRKKVFEAWYGGLCRDLFEAAAKRVYPLFQAYRIPMSSFRIRRMKTRWGSCSPQKRAVTLNLYLAQAPVPCVEYVIAHELAHLVQPNHSPAFYAVWMRSCRITGNANSFYASRRSTVLGVRERHFGCMLLFFPNQEKAGRCGYDLRDRDCQPGPLDSNGGWKDKQ